jgi:hypothetical protein
VTETNCQAFAVLTLANREPISNFAPMLRRVTTMVLPFFVVGCYRYATIAPSGIIPASEVRMNLSASGASALAPKLGRSTFAVEGRILALTDSTYVLAVSSTLARAPDDETSMVRTVWAGESVAIPKGAVAGVEQRSLDGRRTAVAAGVATVLGVLAAKILVHAIGSSGAESGEGMPVVTP